LETGNPGEVAEVREPADSGMPSWALAGRLEEAGESAPSLQVDPGKLEVRAQVKVTFHLGG
jgi:hypothetical protein